MIRTAVVLWLAGLSAAGAASLDEARELIEDGRHRAAIGMLEGLADDPAGERVILLTRACNGTGDWERAVDFGKRSVELAPDSSEAHYGYALAIRNKISEVGKLRAMTLLGSYKRELARAIELDPGNVEALQEEIGYLINAPAIAGRDRDKARERIEELEAVDAGRALFMLAELEAALGNTEAAFGAYRRCLELDPARRDVRQAFAFALQAEKRWQESDAQFKALLGEEAGSAYRLRALYQLGRSRVLGEFDQRAAVDYFDRFLAERPEEAAGSGPGPADALWRRGMALEQLGRQSEARDSYRRALEDDPDHEQARKALRRVR